MLFRLTGQMRVFALYFPGHTLLCRISQRHTRENLVFNAGAVVEVIGIVVMSFDHRDTLALRLSDNSYLVVEDAGGQVEKLAREWSSIRFNPKADQERLAEIQNQLLPLLSAQMQPGIFLGENALSTA